MSFIWAIVTVVMFAGTPYFADWPSHKKSPEQTAQVAQNPTPAPAELPVPAPAP